MTEQSDPIELTISFSPEGEGAILRWEAAVLGVRASLLPPPLPAGDLALALRALDVLQDPGYPLARTAEQAAHFAFDQRESARLAALDLLAESGRIAPDAARRMGRRLFAALVDDPAARLALGTVRDHAVALGRALSLTLAFPPGAERLAALPWELLWDDGPLPLLLARGMAGSLTRRLDLAQALPAPRRAAGPLRILALSPQTGIGPELRQVERAARAAALAPLLARGAVVVEELEPADRAGLVRAIEAGGPPDIVHFYGHGRLRGGAGELLLDDPGGAGWLSASALAALLGGVGMVALYACHGAGLPDGLAGPGDPLLGGVAQALTAAGVPAVLGMQLAVRATAATRVMAAIYGALADGRSLQAGVGLARRALFVEERDGASWFVPALYLRGPATGPVTMRPPSVAPAAPAAPPAWLPPPAPSGARQSVFATRGGVIRALRIQGRAGSQQRVVATRGGTISDVRMIDR